MDLHYMIESTPCRTVMLTAKAAGIKLNYVKCDLTKGEQMKPEYLRMNPQHTVPTLNDNGFYLSESRAICAYLLDRYGKDDSLYPKDPKERALVNQRLYFCSGTLLQRCIDYYNPIIWMGKKPEPEKLEKFKEAVQFLEHFLNGNTWAAGDNLTIADFDLVATVSTVELFDFHLQPYPNVTRWLAKAKKTIPGYEEINHAGCVAYKKRWDEAMSKWK